jgi:N-acetylglucosamine-6-phosphate deacetylase
MDKKRYETLSESKALCESTIDLQINGAFGVDFAAHDLSIVQLEACCERLAAEGVSAFLATIITDSIPNLASALQRLCKLRSSSARVQQMMTGFHVEGPFLSSVTGFVGAHDPTRTKDANIADAKILWDAAEGLIRLVTLAPERDRDGEVVAWLAQRGCLVSIGHSDASLAEIETATQAGASLVTHYGNGCPQLLARHDNILQRLLYFKDRLMFTMIADGAHLPRFFLENMVRLIGDERLIVVSDAIHAAGCGSGEYHLAGRPIRVGEDGIPRTPDGNYLAGSGWTQRRMDRWLAEELGWSVERRRRMFYENPRELLT